MKKLAKFFALAVCAGSLCTLTACSGCNSTTDYTTTTSANWLIRGSAADDLAGGSEYLEKKEVAVYTVSTEQGENTTYSFDYANGTYTTTFYAMAYDWNSESIPSDLRAEESGYVYVYETRLEVPVTITVGDESLTVTNTVSTMSCFRSAEENLLPVYSMQDIYCVSPNALTPVSLDDAYVAMDRVYETWYSYDGTTAQVNVEGRGDDDIETSSNTASCGTEYSLFDSSSLGIALRSTTQSGTHSFDVFVPVNAAAARYQAEWGDTTTFTADDEEYGGIAGALEAATDSGYLLLADTDEEGNKTYSCTAVTVSLVADMSGPSNTYYYAAVSNSDMNAGRAALVRIEETIPFNLGTIVYDLSSLTYEAI